MLEVPLKCLALWRDPILQSTKRSLVCLAIYLDSVAAYVSLPTHPEYEEILADWDPDFAALAACWLGYPFFYPALRVTLCPTRLQEGSCGHRRRALLRHWKVGSSRALLQIQLPFINNEDATGLSHGNWICQGKGLHDQHGKAVACQAIFRVL